MQSLYSFLLYHYRWIILIAMIPYIHLIRRYLLLRYGSVAVIRNKKGTAVVRGFVNDSALIRQYGTDAVIAGICALLIVLSSFFVPFYHSIWAVWAECASVTGLMIIYLVSYFRTEKIRRKVMKMMKLIDFEKMLKAMEQQKNDSLKK